MKEVHLNWALRKHVTHVTNVTRRKTEEKREANGFLIHLIQGLIIFELTSKYLFKLKDGWNFSNVLDEVSGVYRCV